MCGLYALPAQTGWVNRLDYNQEPNNQTIITKIIFVAFFCEGLESFDSTHQPREHSDVCFSMAENTGIEWTDHTFNPWEGCAKISPACENCYAVNLTARRHVIWGKNQERRRPIGTWKDPPKWNRKAEKLGVRYRIFCASLADIFELESDTLSPLDKWRKDVWKLIEETPNLDWLLLTKRIENVKSMVPWGNSWPENVWLGVTVENQKYADLRLPLLLEIPAKIRFISAEPLFSDFEIPKGIDWVISGGESGPDFRPCEIEHVRSIRDQCLALDIPFFFKQWSGNRPKKLGKEVDGREWQETPYTYEGLMKQFPAIEERKIYEYKGAEYIKVTNKVGFKDPESKRFQVGKRVGYFVAVK